MSDSPSEVTYLLARVSDGDSGALDQLMPLVYQDLRARAAACMRRERRDHTLEPTALVHEAWLRLVDQKEADWQGRNHFFAIAARTMRRVLIEHARARHAEKRQGGWDRIPLKEGLLAGRGDVDILEIEDALQKLEEQDERMARVVELRFFGGLSVEEAAAALGVDPRTVKRDWRVARTLLLEMLRDDGD